MLPTPSIHIPVLTSALVLLLTLTPHGSVPAAKGILQYVNPLIGTDAHGHTYPGVSAPFGMVQLSPDTRVAGWDACAGYHYSDSIILGFSHTHLSGTGIPDYGDILVSPTTGPIGNDLTGPGLVSRFNHETEVAEAGYYRVALQDFGITAELTATERVGVHRYTFPEGVAGAIVFDLVHGLGPDRVIDAGIEILSDREISGHRRSEGWARDQRVFFHAVFSRPFDSHQLNHTVSPGPETRSTSGTEVRCALRFRPETDPILVIKVGISFVSREGARDNLHAEVPGWDFDQVKRRAQERWRAELGKVEVEGGTAEQRATFYTALYHTMLAPNLSTDVDGSYRGMDGAIRQVRGHEVYSVFSLWDTFRAEHPLLTVLDRKRTLDFVRSLLLKYRESGTLPVWELASNETWTMIGYHSVPVILDAYVKGIREFDPEEAFAAMKESAMADRSGLAAYRDNGYIPADREGESVSKTLEYAYDDWCIGRMAEELGKVDEARVFRERARSYRNMYDPSSGFMRPKRNGIWVEPFDPAAVTLHYTEANPWQYSFFAIHDNEGLITLMGGRERFVKKLDSLFSVSSRLTGRHQADITGLIGQYAHGNEPSHHVAYLYNYAGTPWKTQETVRLIMDSLYSNRPDGLCGNEDCGQLSAWYVMSALGFYQVCPGEPVYALGSPIFERAIIHLENGKDFVLEASGNSSENRYIRVATLNGSPFTGSWLHHDHIMDGGTLSMMMSAEPNFDRGVGPEDLPPTPPSEAFVSLPSAQAPDDHFRDSVRVSLSCATPHTRIYFRTDGGIPTTNSEVYEHPLVLTASTTLNAVAVTSDGRSSRTMSSRFVKYIPTGTLMLRTAYSQQYPGGGDEALIDQRRGSRDWKTGSWQGYEETDLEAVIDLGGIRTITRVGLSCLQDNNAWIFFPTSVEFSFSRDRIRYGNVLPVRNDISPREAGSILKEFGGPVKEVRARYIRVHARNLGRCPDWHKGAGGKAWLFADEILVETKE